MGLNKVAGHQVATIVTSLEMTARPTPQPLPASPFSLDRWTAPRPGKYRALFRRVGEHWLWFSRLEMSDQRLVTIIQHASVEIFAVCDDQGASVGILELDFREKPQCELSFFGFVPALAGQGHGHWLMAQALERAWRPGIDRVWVHTCTLDHPAALGFYRRAGFIPFRRAVEIFDDPRLNGILPHSCAPHVPILQPVLS